MVKSINRNQKDKWEADVKNVCEPYNEWFTQTAPQEYRAARSKAITDVEELFAATNDMLIISPEVIINNPSILGTLRMATSPPIARDD